MFKITLIIIFKKYCSVELYFSLYTLIEISSSFHPYPFFFNSLYFDFHHPQFDHDVINIKKKYYVFPSFPHSSWILYNFMFFLFFIFPFLFFNLIFHQQYTAPNKLQHLCVKKNNNFVLLFLEIFIVVAVIIWFLYFSLSLSALCCLCNF